MRPRTRRGQVGQIRVVTPQDVKDVAGYVDRAMYSLDNAVTACATLPMQTLTDYNNATIAIRTWLTRANDVGWTTSGLADLYNEGKRHAATLRGWYDRLRTEGCGTVPATPPAPGDPFLSSDNPALLPPGLGTFLGELPPLATMLLVYLVLRELR